ncbi:uncharacterized protein, partial [Maniola hyperantus]|uniref:uncharacterized protein n=1 Tax=Aphantopus hyperantus TaxID=2795564 RepID=UPI003749786D
KKWKSLRDNYMRYKKEVAGTTGQAAKKFTKWPWASQLQFLDSTLTDRERTSNIREPTPETSSAIETQSPETPPPQTPPPRTQSAPPPETPPLETPQTNDTNSSRAKKIKKTDSEMDKVINFLQNKKKQEYDAIDHLFQSYAQTFKSFSKDKQIKAKVELAKLFASIETEELQENVQILNSPHYSIISTEDSVCYAVPNSVPEDSSPVAVIDLSNSTSSYLQQPEQLRQPLREIDILHVTNFGASTSDYNSADFD